MDDLFLGLNGAAALEYVDRGWPVLPIHRSNSRTCACQLGAKCPLRGRHIMYTGSPDIATTNRDAIRSWWLQDEKTAVGVAMGNRSNLIGLELRSDEGVDQLRRAEFENEPIPPALSFAGSDQLPYFLFANPEGPIPVGRVEVMPGVVLLGEGAYLPFPPSPDPRRLDLITQWLTRGTPETIPEWLINLVPANRLVLPSESRGERSQSYLDTRSLGNTLFDLQLRFMDDTVWLAEPWIAYGSKTLVVSRKGGGKSPFVLALIHAVISRRPFLGGITRRTPVVLLTGEPMSIVSRQLGDLPDSLQNQIHIIQLADTDGLSWPNLASAAQAACERSGARLLVIDGLDRWARALGVPSDQDGQLLLPFETGTANGLSVVATWTALAGTTQTSIQTPLDLTVDTKLIVDFKPSQRHLDVRSIGRFRETPMRQTFGLTEANLTTAQLSSSQLALALQ